MSTDIVARLRDLDAKNVRAGEVWRAERQPIFAEAAAELDRLRERNAWLENYVKACDNEIRRARGVIPVLDVGVPHIMAAIERGDGK